MVSQKSQGMVPSTLTSQGSLCHSSQKHETVLPRICWLVSRDWVHPNKFLAPFWSTYSPIKKPHAVSQGRSKLMHMVGDIVTTACCRHLVMIDLLSPIHDVVNTPAKNWEGTQTLEGAYYLRNIKGKHDYYQILVFIILCRSLSFSGLLLWRILCIPGECTWFRHEGFVRLPSRSLINHWKHFTMGKAPVGINDDNLPRWGLFFFLFFFYYILLFSIIIIVVVIQLLLRYCSCYSVEENVLSGNIFSRK